MARLKCDRALPACESCLRRGDVTSCTYQSRKPGSQRHWPASHKTSEGLESRMDRMEQLILKMVENNTQTRSVSKEVAMPLTPVFSEDCSGQQNHVEARLSSPSASDCTELVDSQQEDTCPTKTKVMEIGSEREAPFCFGEAHWAALLNGVGHYSSPLRHSRWAHSCLDRGSAWSSGSSTGAIQ